MVIYESKPILLYIGTPRVDKKIGKVLSLLINDLK